MEVTEQKAEFRHEFYTVQEAAELLRVHENTIYNLVRHKKIEHFRVGNQIRISATELEKMRVQPEIF